MTRDHTAQRSPQRSPAAADHGDERAAAPATLSVHQVVAYNFTRARQQAGWTQVETSDRLEPLLGYRLNQAGVSAIETTYDSERRRNIDAAEIVAFARCFDRPIEWFFLPPVGRSYDLIEPVQTGDLQFFNLPAADLTALVVGSPVGWQDLLDRLAELLNSDPDPTWDALLWALRGQRDDEHWEQQINLRRRALQEVALARLAGPSDEVITNMARLLVQLVRLTPAGYNRLRDVDPEQALALLAEGDQVVAAQLESRLTALERARRVHERTNAAIHARVDQLRRGSAANDTAHHRLDILLVGHPPDAATLRGAKPDVRWQGSSAQHSEAGGSGRSKSRVDHVLLPRLVDLSEIADHLLLAIRLPRIIERQIRRAARRVVAHRQRSVPQPTT